MQHDYVIVGAGSAGATLAARLADAGCDVLLLEAGPDYPSADTPEAMRGPNPHRVITAPEYAPYRFDTLTARRTDAQQPYTYWRGRGVGGSSAINGQIAIRGVPADFDGWVDAGCAGWGWTDVLPYFVRLENDLRFGRESYHGDSGPIPIYRAPTACWGPVDLALAEAALDAGYPWCADHNAPGVLGVSPYAINSVDGRRVSVNDGYLEPRRGANNLHVRGGVLVDTVCFDGDRAVGVRALVDDRPVEFHGARIVLAAGAIHSPAILLRSGLGPSEDLRALDIPVRVDLPVGAGLQDHPVVNVLLPAAESLAVDAEFRHTNCCVRYSSDLFGAHAGDMMMVAMNRLGDSIGAQVGASAGVTTAGLVGVWVNQCESRGKVSLVGRDPREHPAVAENMLATESDRRRLFDGWLRLRSMLASAALRTVAPACVLDSAGTQPRDLDRFEDFDPWARAHVGDTQHGSCSCRMGAAAAPGTVVDPGCRVLGTRELYVVDASVMPSVPCANTNLTTIMIAEKMADRLLAAPPAPDSGPPRSQSAEQRR